MTVPGDNTAAWAAGLFEGEGSIVPRRNGLVMLTLAMLDRDVVERFQQAVGAGAIVVITTGRRRPLWRVDICRTDEVLRVLDLLLPYLGERRRARADELVTRLRIRIADATALRLCAWCQTPFRPPFTPNAAGQRFCTRLCTSRHSNATRARGAA